MTESKAIRVNEKLWTNIMRLKYKEKRTSVAALVDDMYEAYINSKKK